MIFTYPTHMIYRMHIKLTLGVVIEVEVRFDATESSSTCMWVRFM